MVGSFIAKPPLQNAKKTQNKYYYNGGKLIRKPKSDKEVKKSKAGQVNSGVGKAISQLEKIS